MDAALVEYFNTLYLSGHQGHRGEKILAALLDRYPQYGRLGSKKIPRAWRAVRGWRKLTPGTSRRPESLGFWSAVAVELVRQGQLQMAVFTLLSLSAYLRPSEAMGLRRGDVIAPATGVTQHWSLLVAPSERGLATKTGEMDVSVAMDSKWTAGWLPRILKVLSSGEAESCVWRFTYRDFTKLFAKIVAQIGAPSTVPYQWRHSGLSIDRSRLYRTQDEVQKRGRWRVVKSVMRYEKHARLAESTHRFSAAMQAHFQNCEAQLADVVLGRAAAPAMPPSL